MGCRDIKKCEEAACEIRGSTLNPHVYARHIDLASVKSIQRFAEKIIQGRTQTHPEHTHTSCDLMSVIHMTYNNCKHDE